MRKLIHVAWVQGRATSIRQEIRMRKLAPLFMLPLLLGACGDGPTNPGDAVAGMYSLVQLNGSDLPIMVAQDPGRRVEVISGFLTLRSDSSYVATINTQVTPAAGAAQIVPSIENGTYSVSGNSVRFQPKAGASFSGTRDGRTLSYSTPGASATYRKR